LALVPAQAVADWIISWYRVASQAYLQAVEGVHLDRTDPGGDRPQA
jgi:hypothetical protein